MWSVFLSFALGSTPPADWKSVGIGGGGAFFSPSISPHNPAEIFVGSDMSNHFRTTDFGKTWKLTHFSELQVYRDSPKVQFTSDPNLLYMIDYTGEAGRPVRSTDGGKTWSPLASDPTGEEAWSIAADPTGTSRLFVTSYNTLWFSNNGGASFTQKYQAATGNGLLMAGSWFDGNLIVLGTNDGLLLSNDGGQTFTLTPTAGIPTTEAMVSFAAAKSGSTTRFMCVTHPSGSVYNGIQGDDYYGFRSVYTIDWGSGSWVQKTNGITSGSYPFYVGMARNNVDIAYLAGSRDGIPMVLKTTNGGTSWVDNFRTSGNQNIVTGWQGSGGDRDWGYAELCFGFAVCPTDANRAAFTDYGFVHVTSDGGNLWRQAYVDPATENPAGQSTPKRKYYRGIGLEDSASWFLAWADKSTMWASHSDIRGTRSQDGGKSWAFDYTGHTLNASYQVVVHPSTGVMYMATSSVHDLYQSTYLTDARIDGGTGGVLFSADKGKTWQTLGTSITKPTVGLSLDPTHPNRLYATVANSVVGGVYRCDNINAGSSATFAKMPNPPRTEGHAFNIVVLKDGSVITTFSGRRTSNFTASSGVFYSTNAGQTWADRSDPGMYYWTKDITIDPHDPSQNRWYVAVFSGWGGAANGKGGLYRSTNRGQSWVRIAANDRVGSCTIDPLDKNSLYFTTEVEGLWHSGNAQAGTPTFSLVQSFPFRQPERVYFNPHKKGEIWVTTFGGGLWVGQKLRSLL